MYELATNELHKQRTKVKKSLKGGKETRNKKNNQLMRARLNSGDGPVSITCLKTSQTSKKELD